MILLSVASSQPIPVFQCYTLKNGRRTLKKIGEPGDKASSQCSLSVEYCYMRTCIYACLLLLCTFTRPPALFIYLFIYFLYDDGDSVVSWRSCYLVFLSAVSWLVSLWTMDCWSRAHMLLSSGQALHMSTRCLLSVRGLFSTSKQLQ